MKFRFIALTTLLLGLVSGCYSTIDQNSPAPGSNQQGIAMQLCPEPVCITAADISEDELLAWAEASGYVLLESDFYEYHVRYSSEERAIRRAASLGACLVWTDRSLARIDSGSRARTVLESIETLTTRDARGRIISTETIENTQTVNQEFSYNIYAYRTYYFARSANAPTATVKLVGRN